MWWKLAKVGTSDVGAYVHGDLVKLLFADADGSTWVVRAADDIGLSPQSTLAGTYTTQAAAEDAIRRLVHGIDPST
jgi:hypothetical protein